MKLVCNIGLVLIGLGVAAAHPAAAQVIYQDNFSMGTAGSINGQKPSTDTGNATYTVLSSDNYSGSQNGTSDVTETGGTGPATFALSSNTPAMVEAFLPYVVTSTGSTVTLSATASMPADTTWFTLGFAQNTTSSPFDSGIGPGPWILVRGATGSDSYEAWTGPGVNGSGKSTGTLALTPGSFTFSETLNPTTLAFSADYNGTPFYTTTLSSLPAINDVFFGEYVDNSNKGGRAISNFSLIAAPEPSQSTGLLLGIAVTGGLLLLARKRRQCAAPAAGR